MGVSRVLAMPSPSVSAGVGSMGRGTASSHSTRLSRIPVTVHGAAKAVRVRPGFVVEIAKFTVRAAGSLTRVGDRLLDSMTKLLVRPRARRPLCRSTCEAAMQPVRSNGESINEVGKWSLGVVDNMQHIGTGRRKGNPWQRRHRRPEMPMKAH